MLLQCKQITRQYEKSGKSICMAVKEADFHVDAKDFICIVGKSGSGKSTLLNVLAGLLKPSSGIVLWKNCDIWGMDPKTMAYLRNSELGYVPQGISLLGNLTVMDNVRLPHCLYKRKGNGSERALELLEKVGLKNRADSYPSELSGGEMKRVAIARALMNSPQLLIADEPTADIDEETTYDIMRLFIEVCSEGTAILMATHELENVKYGNHVLKMADGVLTEEPICKYENR